MGLNDLVLTPQLLSTLYPGSLVVPPDAEKNIRANPVSRVEEAGTQQVQTMKSLGDNQKKILVVVNYTNAVHLPDDALEFLTNMLRACGLGLADVAIINMNNYPDSLYREITAYFNSRIIFLFDVEPVRFGLPLNFPPYQVQSFANTTFLFTPSLDEQRNDPLLKSKLWISLRHIFNI